jgi:penicillin amidase
VVPFEVVPLGEMPHVVNPPAGFAVNANNDPDGLTLANDPLARQRPGGGLLYLAPGFDAGFRAGRITARVRGALARGKMTFEEMQSIQADVHLLDADVLVPSIVAALGNARRAGAPAALAALAASPGVAEAVGRLDGWDRTTPTGIKDGYDASDVDGRLARPGPREIEASVAATLYAVWRGQALRNVIDAHLGPLPVPPGQQAMTALRNLLDRFPDQQGVGASGVDFFAVPGFPASPEDRRDLLLLRSMADALGLLSGPAFADAFHGSTAQDDYRWGKLHRIVFSHPMGGPFSVPPAFGQFPAPLAPLPGIPTDGGFGVPDASNHDPRANGAGGFMFSSGPSNRLVVELTRGEGKRAESVWPGGASAVPSSPWYLNLLPLWLTNDTVPLLDRKADVARSATRTEEFLPER